MKDMLNNTLKKVQNALIFLVDIISIALSIVLVVLFGGRIDPMFSVTWAEMKSFSLMVAFTFVVLFFFFSPSKNMISRSYKRIFATRILLNIAGLLVLTTVMFVCDSPLNSRRAPVLAMVLLDFVFMFILHSLLKLVLTGKVKRRVLATLTAVYTSSQNAGEIINSFKTDWSRKIIGVAFFDRENAQEGETVDGVEVKSGRGDFLDWIRRESVDEVFIDASLKDEEYISRLLPELEVMGVTVHITVPFLNGTEDEAGHRSFSYINGHPTLTYAMKVHNRLGLIIKRLFDISCALIGIVISIPVILIVAIPLLIESPGPLFFAQKRVGKNGRVFKMYKLRSMCVGADDMKKDLAEQNEMQGLMFKMKDDPRITRVGKFIRKTSIDELPQFINILLGDMSLIGTRPPTLDEYNQYMSHHKRRLSLKPGLTGLWQVSGRNEISDFEEVVRLDLQYIDNWNLLMDIKIIFKTVAVVFSRKGSE